MIPLIIVVCLGASLAMALWARKMDRIDRERHVVAEAERIAQRGYMGRR